MVSSNLLRRAGARLTLAVIFAFPSQAFVLQSLVSTSDDLRHTTAAITSKSRSSSISNLIIQTSVKARPSILASPPDTNGVLPDAPVLSTPASTSLQKSTSTVPPTLPSTPNPSPRISPRASTTFSTIAILSTVSATFTAAPRDDSSPDSLSSSSASLNSTSSPTSAPLPTAATAGISVGITLAAVAILFLIGALIYRRRTRRRRIQSHRNSSASDINWNTMLKPVRGPNGSMKKPSPSSLTRNRPLIADKPMPGKTTDRANRQLILPSRLEMPAKIQPPLGRAQARPAVRTIFTPKDTDRMVFEMPGSAGASMSAISDTSTMVELEGCTPVEQEGRFVWPSPARAKGSARSSLWSGTVPRREVDPESPAVPPKDFQYLQRRRGVNK